MKEIQLSKQGKNKGKYIAFVDDEDFERVNQFRWRIVKGKNSNYASREYKADGEIIYQYMHSFILNIKSDYKNPVDHIDHNGLNCQKYNMRLCTPSQNHMNRVPGNNFTSIYKGVCWKKRESRWCAKIMINKTEIYIGVFTAEIDAAKAYDKKAKEIFGEFAFLNFH